MRDMDARGEKQRAKSAVRDSGRICVLEKDKTSIVLLYSGGQVRSRIIARVE